MGGEAKDNEVYCVRGVQGVGVIKQGTGGGGRGGGASRGQEKGV